jgi:citrate lyase subunit beta/citryl-CoA lyase
VLPLIESALGFEQRLSLAHAEGVQRLAFGHIDFQADMNMRATEDELLPFRVALVLASRLADIAPPIDGVTTALDDAELLRIDVLRARRLGFGGKLCIHPRQVVVVNACFTPDADEIAWAQRVIAADAAAGGAAVAVDGKMVDRPVVLRAQAILAEAAARKL